MLLERKAQFRSFWCFKIWFSTVLFQVFAIFACSGCARRATHTYVVCRIKGEKLPRQVSFYWHVCCLADAEEEYIDWAARRLDWSDSVAMHFLLRGGFFWWGRNKLTYWLIEGENWLGEAVRIWWMLTAGKKGFSNICTNIYFFPHLSAFYLMRSGDGWLHFDSLWHTARSLDHCKMGRSGVVWNFFSF